MATIPIPFSEKTVKASFARARATCECSRFDHPGAPARCTNMVVFENRGRDLPFGWEAHPVDPSGPPVPQNCQVLCWPCHVAAILYKDQR